MNRISPARMRSSAASLPRLCTYQTATTRWSLCLNWFAGVSQISNPRTTFSISRSEFIRSLLSQIKNRGGPKFDPPRKNFDLARLLLSRCLVGPNRQPRLVTRSRILVHDALLDRLVDHGNGDRQHLLDFISLA